MTPRISASSYSNTAPLIWSFIYGTNRGKVELILDNAPARSAELLQQDRVDAALVPVIASQFIDDVRLVPDICVGAKERVQSVRLVTRGIDLADVRSVSLDTSSKTSVVLAKIIFREFLGFEPVWRPSPPDIEKMLQESDAALLIGDPALTLAGHRSFDMAELWRSHTGLGFVFAMWMTRRSAIRIDFAGARDEGVAHASDIASSYAPQIGLSEKEIFEYLTGSISYSLDDSMRQGMELYLQLAARHGLTEGYRPVAFI